MTAGDEGRGTWGWVPPPPPAENEPGPAEPEDVETRPISRAAVRAAYAARLEAEAQERRRASLASETEVPQAPRLLGVGVAVALAVLVGLSALVGAGATAATVGFASVVLAYGWVRLTDAPSPRVAGIILALAGVAVAASVGLTRTDPYLTWVPVAVAVSVVVAFLHQVLRGGGRPRLTEGIASSVGALALMASGATFVPVAHYPQGGAWVLGSGLAVAAAALPTLLLGGRWAGTLVLGAAVVLGTAVAVASAAVAGLPLLWAAATGVLVSGISHSMTRVLLALPGARHPQASVAVGSGALLTVGVVVYLLGRVVLG